MVNDCALFRHCHTSSRSRAGVSEGERAATPQAESFSLKTPGLCRDTMLALLPPIYLLLVGARGAGASDPTLPFMEYLDNEHLVCLKWGFDDLQGEITFKLVVNTTGWVGFGFSPKGGMGGADIVMGGLGPSGTYFTDRHAKGNSMPIVDTEQSYTLQSITESDGQTIATFSRSIRACDDQDFHITTKPIKLIYAYGPTDDMSYHGSRRGTKEVNLLNYMPRTVLPDSNYLSARVENITVPPKHTYYHCKVMKFESLSEKHHVYKIEPVIDHPDLIHHMLLYACPPYVNKTYDRPCYRGDIGDHCFTVVATWGVGGGVFEFPDDTGIPVGGVDRHKHYRLEIHYNNPTKVEGRMDSSGLRLHYTQPRKYDVGILLTGVLPSDRAKYDIPPRADHFRTYGVCNTSLFSQVLNPVPDLHVFGVMLHTHLAGIKVRVGHFRNGEQIDFLGYDENYDFEMQQATWMGKIKTIKHGDEIVVECTYRTVSRDAFTKMGLATTDEMCLAFLVFYPANSISSCISQPDIRNWEASGYQFSDGDTTTNQDEIAKYESSLKNLPQVQLILGEAAHASYPNGTVREMMKTPTMTCESTNASSKLKSSWILNLAGIIFPLFLMVIM